MIHAAIRFKRAGLEDDDATLARNVNGFAGYNCAKWLTQGVRDMPDAQVRGEPVAEDWGWALVVDVGKDAFVLGCSIDPDNEGSWQVLLGDNGMRGLLPATRRRRTTALEMLTNRVRSFLNAQKDVSDVTVDA